jgi:hypothetical protein
MVVGSAAGGRIEIPRWRIEEPRQRRIRIKLWRRATQIQT